VLVFITCLLRSSVLGLAVQQSNSFSDNHNLHFSVDMRDKFRPLHNISQAGRMVYIQDSKQKKKKNFKLKIKKNFNYFKMLLGC